jgi:hypothetical protein
MVSDLGIGAIFLSGHSLASSGQMRRLWPLLILLLLLGFGPGGIDCPPNLSQAF